VRENEQISTKKIPGLFPVQGNPFSKSLKYKIACDTAVVVVLGLVTLGNGYTNRNNSVCVTLPKVDKESIDSDQATAFAGIFTTFQQCAYFLIY
jgi:hypothetical protein